MKEYMEMDEDFLIENYNEKMNSDLISLWRMVIIQSLEDLKSQSNKALAKSFRSSAVIWLSLSNKDFIDICCYADFEPSYIIKKVNEIKNNSIFLNKILIK
ncbi:MAG: hypothetical protein LBT02_01800 [Rickettsiales bacterium]|jgi:hypothetical protein|nr:hypothetical protein [Rickettsiales bacterium]